MNLHHLLSTISVLVIFWMSIEQSGDSARFGMNSPKKEVVSLSFQLIDDEISVHNNLESTVAEALAKISYKNDGQTTIIMSETIVYGHKSDRLNHIEVRDAMNQNVEVDNSMDYDFFMDPIDPTPKEVILEPGETQIDTIDLNTFYHFAHKGVFTVRFVDTRFRIQSNWDTLLVK
ncbi:MAG: hypothetical protein AAFZ63_19400 [Bacteroidota bacterium]